MHNSSVVSWREDCRHQSRSDALLKHSTALLEEQSELRAAHVAHVLDSLLQSRPSVDLLVSSDTMVNSQGPVSRDTDSTRTQSHLFHRRVSNTPQACSVASNRPTQSFALTFQQELDMAFVSECLARSRRDVITYGPFPRSSGSGGDVVTTATHDEGRTEAVDYTTVDPVDSEASATDVVFGKKKFSTASSGSNIEPNASVSVQTPPSLDIALPPLVDPGAAPSNVVEPRLSHEERTRVAELLNSGFKTMYEGGDTFVIWSGAGKSIRDREKRREKRGVSIFRTAHFNKTN